MIAEDWDGVSWKVLFDDYPDPSFILAEDGFVRRANKAACGLLERSPDELIGIAFETLIVDGAGAFKDLSSLHRKSVLGMEVMLLAKNGVVLPTLLRCRRMAGKPSLLLAVAHDVSEFKNAQDELRRQVEASSSITETAGVSIVALDLAGRIIFFNRAAEVMSGYNRVEVIGKEWMEMFVPEGQWGMVLERLSTQKRDRRDQSFQCTLISKEGQERDVNWRTGTLEDLEGKPWGVLCIGLDVTEQKLLEEQLFQAEKLSSIGKLVAGVAHELNNPLTTILGFAEFLREAHGLPGDAASALEAICHEAKRSAHLVRSLLTFSRQRKPEKEECSLNELIETILGIQDRRIEKSDIRVETDLDRTLPPIHGDPSQLQQVLLNLFSNAFDAVEENKQERPGLVRLRTQSIEGCAVMEVEDNGPGIKKEYRRKIFDPFFTTKPPGKGTGLGLSIAYGIVKEHGGHIYLASPPTEGGRFVVELPYSAAVSREPAEPLRRVKCLLVTDDLSLGEWLDSVLRDEAVDLEQTDSLHKALERIRQGSIPMVLVDSEVDGTPGSDVCERILASWPDLKKHTVLMVDSSEPGLPAPPEAVHWRQLVKPFTVGALKELVRSLLETVEED